MPLALRVNYVSSARSPSANGDKPRCIWILQNKRTCHQAISGLTGTVTDVSMTTVNKSAVLRTEKKYMRKTLRVNLPTAVRYSYTAFIWMCA